MTGASPPKNFISASPRRHHGAPSRLAMASADACTLPVADDSTQDAARPSLSPQPSYMRPEAQPGGTAPAIDRLQRPDCAFRPLSASMCQADIGRRCGEAEFRGRACFRGPLEPCGRRRLDQIRRKDVLMMDGNAIREPAW